MPVRTETYGRVLSFTTADTINSVDFVHKPELAVL